MAYQIALLCAYSCGLQLVCVFLIVRSSRSGHHVMLLSTSLLLLSPVYTIQPPVKPVVRRFDNRLNVCIHDTAGCKTRLTTGCILYTDIEPVVKCVSQLVGKPAVLCIQPVVKTVLQPGFTTG